MFGKLLYSLRFSNRSTLLSPLHPKNLYSFPTHLLQRFHPEELGHNPLHKGLFLVRCFSSRKNPMEEESDFSDWVSEINSKSLRSPSADIGNDRGKSTEVRDRSLGRHENRGFRTSSSIRGNMRETCIDRDSQFPRQKDGEIRGFRRDDRGGSGALNPSEMKSGTRKWRGDVDYSTTGNHRFSSNVVSEKSSDRHWNSEPLTGNSSGNVKGSPLFTDFRNDDDDKNDTDDSELESFWRELGGNRYIGSSKAFSRNLRGGAKASLAGNGRFGSNFKNEDDEDDSEDDSGLDPVRRESPGGLNIHSSKTFYTNSRGSAKASLAVNSQFGSDFDNGDDDDSKVDSFRKESTRVRKKVNIKGLGSGANYSDYDDYSEMRRRSSDSKLLRPTGEIMGRSELGEDVLQRKDDKSSDDELENSNASEISSSEATVVSYLSNSRFDQYELSPLILKAIRDLGFENMTVVQEATLRIILKGLDVIAKAKTGTGKTMAFLLPCIEIAVKSPPHDGNLKYPPIIALIICPTRELASQAAKEAQALLKYHSGIGVHVFTGGVSFNAEKTKLNVKPCQILVATPGRLKDHIDNTAGFVTRLSGLKVLVLDEVDQLLDMGFRHHIKSIISYVPKERQTLLFSATITPSVREFSGIVLKKIYRYIDTVPAGSEEAHTQVKQMHMVAPLNQHFTILYSLLNDRIANDANYKIIVFCTTVTVTNLVAQLLQALDLNCDDVHSRKSQSYRTNVLDEFRNSKVRILVTSDVFAHWEFPDVTLVLQMGRPFSRQEYIHRLGRAGHKDNERERILLLAPWEESFLYTIKDQPLKKAQLPMIDPIMTQKVMQALSKITMKAKESAYRSWLGHYIGLKNTLSNDKERLVALANDFSKSMGLPCPPAIAGNIINKMGLKNVPGLTSK